MWKNIPPNPKSPSCDPQDKISMIDANTKIKHLCFIKSSTEKFVQSLQTGKKQKIQEINQKYTQNEISIECTMLC